jgi:hypothetical protein
LLPLFAICQDKLTVTVHPGVELFTIIQILADKYPKPNPSAYSKEALEYFGKFKDHPAVKKVLLLRKLYTDLVELGWCMSDFPNIKIYEPADYELVQILRQRKRVGIHQAVPRLF